MNFKINVIANYFGKFVSILSNFIFIPLYISILGFENYSIISFCLVVAGIMVVLDSGLTATLSRELARADQNSEEKIKIFKTLESIYLLISFFAICILFLLSNIISSGWLTSSRYNSSDISLFIKIFSFDVGFQLLFRFYLGGFLGLEKQIKSNSLQILWGLSRNGLVLIVIAVFPTLITFFIWQSSVSFLFVLISGTLLRKELLGLIKLKFYKIEKEVIKKSWKFAAGVLLISLVAAMNTQMDKLAISKLLPIENLGHYTIAVSLSMGIFILINPISSAILPRFTNYFSSGQVLLAQDLFNKVNRIVSVLVFSMLSCMFYFRTELIWIWTGSTEIALQSGIYIPYMALGISFLSMQILPYNIAIANGNTKLNYVIGIISLCFSLPGYWIGTIYFGAIGAAFVFSLIQVVITFVYLYFIQIKYFDSNNIFYLFWKSIFSPLLITLSIGYFFSFTPDFFQITRLSMFLWILISSFLIFSISFISLYFNIIYVYLYNFTKQSKL